MLKKFEILAKPNANLTSPSDQMRIRNLQLENEVMVLKKQQSSQSTNNTQAEKEENDLSSSLGTTQTHFNRIVREKILDYYPGRPFEKFAFYEKNPTFMKELKSKQKLTSYCFYIPHLYYIFRRSRTSISATQHHVWKSNLKGKEFFKNYAPQYKKSNKEKCIQKRTLVLVIVIDP